MLPRVVALSSATFGCVPAPSLPKNSREEKLRKPKKLRRKPAPPLQPSNSTQPGCLFSSYVEPIRFAGAAYAVCDSHGLKQGVWIPSRD